VSPRPYRKRARQEAVDETRLRIIAAARELLSDPAGVTSFTIDGVAARADVARMTVYYQFKSKRGVLEALFDDVAARGGMGNLREAFLQNEPAKALEAFVERFVRFYASERIIIRRANALAALDPEVDAAMRERIGWRKEALTELTRRLGIERNTRLVDTLVMLLGFESFDLLARGRRSIREITRILIDLANAAIEQALND